MDELQDYSKRNESRAMKSKTVLQWTQELGAKEGKYTGGSAASVVAAISASLAQFVFELQAGKKKYREQEELIQAGIQKASRLNEELLDLSERDANAFAPVLDLYKLPQNTEEEKRIRQEKIDDGLINAALPPFEIILKLDEVVDLFQQLINLDLKGTIAGDITVGLHTAIAGIEGALINTMANINSIKDNDLRSEMNDKVMEQYQITLAKAKELKEVSIK